MHELEGFILAGGASSRMGTDKARLRLGGRDFVERIAAALNFVAARVSLVSARPDAGEWGLPVVADIYPNCGALGGIHAALTNSSAPWAVVVSCDLPFVTGELFARLAALRRADGTGGGAGADAGGAEFAAVAPVQEDGRAQPLCALYARAACLERAEALLRDGERRPRELLRQTHTRWVEPRELCDLQDAPLFFLNVNTPEDYAHALSVSRRS